MTSEGYDTFTAEHFELFEKLAKAFGVDNGVLAIKLKVVSGKWKDVNAISSTLAACRIWKLAGLKREEEGVE